MVKGAVHLGFLVQSLSEPTFSYAVRRREIDEVSDALGHGALAVVVLSRLANGKTTLSECIAGKLRDRFDVFAFSKGTLSLRDEIQALRAPARPTLILIDD